MIKINNNKPTHMILDSTEIKKLYYRGHNIYWSIKDKPKEHYDYAVIDSTSDYYSDIDYQYCYGDKTWYRLNDNGNLEPYGIIEVYENDSALAQTTTYPNKLAVVGEREYQYQNGDWVDVGSYHSSFGQIGTISQESFPSGSQFPTSFAVRKSDVEANGFLEFSIYGMNGDMRISVSDWSTEYRINDWEQGGDFNGVITSDDTYYYFSCPDYPNETFEVMDLMWWQDPLPYYGGSISYDVEYDNLDYPTANGYYYEDELPKGKLVVYNSGGTIVEYNGNDYETRDINPYFEFVKVSFDDDKGKYAKMYSFAKIYSIGQNDKLEEVTEVEDRIPYVAVLSDPYMFKKNENTTACGFIDVLNIPNTVKTIGEKAFYGSNLLANVTIPSSVTSIGEYAFQDCTSLTSVTIPNSVTSIGYAAFQYCSSLTSVTIPNSVTSIGEYAFQDCTSLTSVTIPNSVTSIGYAAFVFCSGLTSVIWNSPQQHIATATFRKCTNLKVIDFSGGATQVLRFGNYSTATGVGGTNDIDTTSLQYIVVPDSLYSSWYNSSYWANFKQYIIKKSDYDKL